jgi:hypothetical protein
MAIAIFRQVPGGFVLADHPDTTMSSISQDPVLDNFWTAQSHRWSALPFFLPRLK